MARRTEPGGLGAKLREARKARGLTQKQLAERAGLSQSAVNMIEKGKRHDPSLSTIAALERVLNISLDSAPVHPSLKRFLGSDLAARLQITPAEANELAAVLWWGGPPGEDPTDDEWYDFVRLRRSVIERRKRT